ncbi:hypothetical protein LTS13_006417 [Exophiala xenobiotica]|nr:hypothetical protein LTS06_008054 [Exophiala xenobiotica]KAK5371040.1 hypothetical protein LTS13_006417 [Exophiala xenobiotica]KAK5506565.1 hypothetical protein LTR83_001118 [Exophiala xenobiotica]KAK5518858.1 hypothetical protein LTR07_005828 [Exophiala xenobiotica]KAK5523269.1 hypothetical protein LTR21_001117 [Exophiala xenobiotica]
MQNASTIGNYGLGDAVQFMVSTDGKTIRGTNRGLGWRTRQVRGHMSDDSVQQLSGDMTASPSRTPGTERSPGRGDTPVVSDNGTEVAHNPDFEQYGKGFKFISKPVSKASTSFPGSGENPGSKPPGKGS